MEPGFALLCWGEEDVDRGQTVGWTFYLKRESGLGFLGLDIGSGLGGFWGGFGFGYNNKKGSVWFKCITRTNFAILQKCEG